eukprot:8784347-Lingulodinium_polyedra.AAC.1
MDQEDAEGRRHWLRGMRRRVRNRLRRGDTAAGQWSAVLNAVIWLSVSQHSRTGLLFALERLGIGLAPF